MTNRAGPGYKEELWAKNITDNTPEVKVVETGGPNTSGIPEIRLLRFHIHRAGLRLPRQDLMLINNYSENNCAGWLAFSHYMMAGWDTDSGQRIGSALEIEGVSGATGTSSGSTQTPPPAPTLY
jgi:hypothetical protein